MTLCQRENQLFNCILPVRENSDCEMGIITALELHYKEPFLVRYPTKISPWPGPSLFLFYINTFGDGVSAVVYGSLHGTNASVTESYWNTRIEAKKACSMPIDLSLILGKKMAYHHSDKRQLSCITTNKNKSPVQYTYIAIAMLMVTPVSPQCYVNHKNGKGLYTT